jgi:hypothetical protein
MQKRAKFIVLGVVLFGALGLIVWQMAPPPSEQELTYRGKPLRALLKITWVALPAGEVGYTGNWEDIEQAVGEIGTNAIPTLLRWSSTRNSDSRLKIGVMRLLARQPIIKVHFASSSGLSYAATYGFRALGTNAAAAVPALVQIANGKPGSRNDAILSLSYIGPAAAAAVPSLVHLTGDTNWYLRVVTFMSLGRIHSRPEEVFPALLNGLQDTNPRVRMSAAYAFAGFGESAASAVPQLIAIASSTPSGVSNTCAIQALGCIGPGAKEAVPHLFVWATNSDSQMQSEARTAILQIDPEAAARAGITNKP